jgi:hypothetical protein
MTSFFNILIKAAIILVLVGIILAISTTLSFAEELSLEEQDAKLRLLVDEEEYERLMTQQPVRVAEAWVQSGHIFAKTGTDTCPLLSEMYLNNCRSIIKNWVQLEIYYIDYYQGLIYCDALYAVGCVAPDHLDENEAAIYLVEGYNLTTPTYGGCTVVYHELLHAMGYTHEMMAKHYPNDDCKLKKELRIYMEKVD